jgi:hypothetical protein
MGLAALAIGPAGIAPMGLAALAIEPVGIAALGIAPLGANRRDEAG